LEDIVYCTHCQKFDWWRIKEIKLKPMTNTSQTFSYFRGTVRSEVIRLSGTVEEELVMDVLIVADNPRNKLLRIGSEPISAPTASTSGSINDRFIFNHVPKQSSAGILQH